MSTLQPHGFSRVVWLVVAMTMATLPFLSLLPPWLTLAIIALAAWRLVVEHRGLVVVPTLPVRLLLVSIAALLLLISGNLGFGLTAATPLFVALLWSKLLELKARRDFLIACVLNYFLVAVLLFDRQSLFTCLYAIATLGAITVALVSYHLEPGVRGSFRLGFRLMLQGLPLAAALFVLFPRFQVNFPNLGQATSGFSDHLTPSDVARMALNDDPVMRVTFPEGALPSTDQLYWRGLVLSETKDGTTWTAKPRPAAYNALPAPRDAKHVAVVQDIALQPLNQRWLFALDVAEHPPEQTALAFNRCLVRRYTPTQVLHYRVTSRLGELSTDLEGLGVTLPEDLDPRVRALAQQWRSGGGDTLAIVERGLAWYHDNGFTYSLAPGVMEAGTPEFLFERKTGFCAHYATSFALVLRTAGIPARVVVGFRGGERNPFGDFLQIRTDHAHAWCEVHLRDGWHRVDPTLGIPLAPGETQPAAQRTASGEVLSETGRGPSWLPAWLRGSYARVNQWLSFVDAKWEADVIGMDGARQDEWFASHGLRRYGTVVLVVLIILTLVLVVAGFFLWSRVRPSRRLHDPLVEAWAQFGECMARLGVARQSSEGPQDFSRRAGAALPMLADDIHTIVNLYVVLRYGHAGVDTAAFTRLQLAIRRLPRQQPMALPQAAAAGTSAPVRSG